MGCLAINIVVLIFLQVFCEQLQSLCELLQECLISLEEMIIPALVFNPK
jgi:hypothetical protein